MNYYRQPIVLFGLIVPLLCCAVVVGSGLFVMADFQEKLKFKESAFQTDKALQIRIKELEKEVHAERPHLERWRDELSKETASSVSNTLRRILNSLPAKEIQQTGFERPEATGGFGSASLQNSSIIRVGFRGTFRTIQRALLELESLKPQLHIVEMKIDPVGGQSSHINIQITYSVWEN